MYKKYAIVRCAEDINDIPFRFSIIKHFPKNYIRNYLIKKTPLDVVDINYFANEGLEIKLPIITSIINDENEEYIKKIINNFNRKLLQYNVNVIILSQPLKTYKKYFDSIVADANEVQILYIKNIINKLLNFINKELKHIKFAIIDGYNSTTDYIIDNIYSDINALTIVTSRPEKYEEKLEQIYDETGLAIQITNTSITQEIDSDIIINCSNERDKLFYCFKEDAYIIDFVSDDTKIKDIMIKRSDITIITTADFYVDNQLISKDLFHGLLLNQNRLLRSMYLYGYKSGMTDRINSILNKYNLSVGNMYQRGGQIRTN